MASTSSHTQAGTEVVNVLAEDKDGGIFGEVLYEIIPGEKTSLFTIDSSTGNGVSVYLPLYHLIQGLLKKKQ